MKENNEMKTYDFIEGTEFTGLMSKAIDAAPGVVGKSEVNVRFFDTSKGCDAMAMVDLWAFYEKVMKVAVLNQEVQIAVAALIAVQPIQAVA